MNGGIIPMAKKEEIKEEIIETVVEEPAPEEDEGGKIVFANEVVATIASLGAAEVDGVASLGGTVISGLSELFGKKPLTKGIKVDILDKDVTIEATLNIKYGYRIHDVCKNVQESVKNAVENMTGLNVKTVDTYVQSVVFEKEETEPVIVETDVTPEPEDAE